MRIENTYLKISCAVNQKIVTHITTIDDFERLIFRTLL